MNPAATRDHRRKIHYIDHALQKWLLIALVILEMLILCAAGAVLYFDLNAIVDANLYRVHLQGQPTMFAALLKESLQILAALVGINLIALLLADRIWVNYVNGILAGLSRLLLRSRDLDFGPDDDQARRHRVIERALAWRQTERERNREIRRHCAELERLAADPVHPAEFRATLLTLRASLPARKDP